MVRVGGSRQSLAGVRWAVDGLSCEKRLNEEAMPLGKADFTKLLKYSPTKSLAKWKAKEI